MMSSWVQILLAHRARSTSSGALLLLSVIICGFGECSNSITEAPEEYWLTLVEAASPQPESQALGRVLLAQGSADAGLASLRIRVQGGSLHGLEDRGCSGSSCCLQEPKWPLSFLAECEDVECVVLADVHTSDADSGAACGGSLRTSAVPVVLRRAATNSPAPDSGIEALDAGPVDATVDAGEGAGS